MPMFATGDRAIQIWKKKTILEISLPGSNNLMCWTRQPLGFDLWIFHSHS